MLPNGIVGVVNGKGRQATNLAIQKRFVKCRKLLVKNGQRRAVTHDVMEVQNENVLIVAKAYQFCPHERSLLKVVWLVGIVG